MGETIFKVKKKKTMILTNFISFHVLSQADIFWSVSLVGSPSHSYDLVMSHSFENVMPKSLPLALSVTPQSFNDSTSSPGSVTVFASIGVFLGL